MIIDSYSFSDKGGREENQDSIIAEVHDKNGIFVVADGLGGHRGGRAAAECVSSVICETWKSKIPEEAECNEEWMNKAFEAANDGVMQLQLTEACQMRSTAAVLLISGNTAVWANAGDSRVYKIHHGKLESVTEDHSVAYRKFKAGEISKEQIASDEDQSHLLKDLGNEDRWRPAVYSGSAEPGDCFLLCSDGLWEYVYDTEILVDSLKSFSARGWARLLLLRAIERVRPGNDNLSLITVMIK